MQLNTTQTKKAVERTLGEYRRYLLQATLEQMPKLTSTYSLVPPSGGFSRSSSTEKAAIANVDYERRRKEVMELVIHAVNKLSMRERSIIAMKYLGEEEIFDYEVYTELNLSHRHYYRIKAQAIQKMGIAMKIAVYEEDAVLV